MDILVASDDPGADDVQALAGAYLSFAHDTSPPEHALALDAERLADPSVSFFAIRRGGVLSVGRAKSSTRARAARGQGVGGRWSSTWSRSPRAGAVAR
jgi:hypothetical protein